MRIGTKYFLGLSFNQVGLRFSPFEGLDQHHHSLGCEFGYSVTQHSPLCTNCFWWEPHYTFYDLLYIYICYADHMERSALKYRRHQLLSSLHWCGAWGDTCTVDKKGGVGPVLKIWFGPPNADFWSVWSFQKARKFRQIQPTTKVRSLCFEWKRICFQTRDVLCSYNNMNYEVKSRQWHKH